MAETICIICPFYKDDIILDGIGYCKISGRMHYPEDVCEAEKGVKADGGKQNQG